MELNNLKIWIFSYRKKISKLSEFFSVLKFTLSFLDKVEIINSFTGKTVCNKYSRLTKQNMFRRFGRIVTHLPNIINRSIDKDYCEEKASAIEYQVGNVFFVKPKSRPKKKSAKNSMERKKNHKSFKRKKKSASICSTTFLRFFSTTAERVKLIYSSFLPTATSFFHLKASSKIHFHFFSLLRFRMRKANSSRRSIAKNWAIG